MTHKFTIDVIAEETETMFLCVYGTRRVWIPRGLVFGQLGECEVKAEMPLEQAYALGLLERSLSVSLCRTCGARIVWARTAKGKTMPVDAEPVEFGGNVVIRNGVAVVLAKGEASGTDEKRHHSHFTTCRTAAMHRTPKTRKPKPEKKEPVKTPDLFGE